MPGAESNGKLILKEYTGPDNMKNSSVPGKWGANKGGTPVPKMGNDDDDWIGMIDVLSLFIHEQCVSARICTFPSYEEHFTYPYLFISVCLVFTCIDLPGIVKIENKTSDLNN